MTKNEIFIQKAVDKQGVGRYDYSQVNYVNSRTKITIICPTHGEFSISPENHLRGRGCPACSKQAKIKKLKKSTSEVESKLRIDEFEYPNFKYTGARGKITVKCKTCGNTHTPTWDNHINKKRSCKFCSGGGKRSVKEALQLLDTSLYSFPNFTKEFKEQRSKITIVCKRCKRSVKKRYDLFKKDPYCAICDDRHHKFTEKEAFSYLPHSEYEFPLFFDEFENVHSNITVVHKKCGNRFSPSYYNIKEGRTYCPTCSEEGMKLGLDVILTRLHTDTFEYPNIKREYKNVHSKVSIKCKSCGHTFKGVLRYHIRSGFCKVCDSSLGEKAIIDILSSYNFILDKDYVREFKIEPFNYRYDFKINNYLIEFDGIQHFEEDNTWASQGNSTLEDIQRRDKEKDKLAKDFGYILIRIAYFDLSKIRQILVEEVLKPLGYV